MALAETAKHLDKFYTYSEEFIIEYCERHAESYYHNWEFYETAPIYHCILMQMIAKNKVVGLFDELIHDYVHKLRPIRDIADDFYKLNDLLGANKVGSYVDFVKIIKGYEEYKHEKDTNS